MLSKDQRFELGQKVIKEYLKSTKKPYFKKVKANTHDFDGMVLYYPPEFTKRMDKLILNYYRAVDREVKRIMELNTTK